MVTGGCHTLPGGLCGYGSLGSFHTTMSNDMVLAEVSMAAIRRWAHRSSELRTHICCPTTVSAVVVVDLRRTVCSPRWVRGHRGMMGTNGRQQQGEPAGQLTSSSGSSHDASRRIRLWSRRSRVAASGSRRAATGVCNDRGAHPQSVDHHHPTPDDQRRRWSSCLCSSPHPSRRAGSMKSLPTSSASWSGRRSLVCPGRCSVGRGTKAS